jgi:hypothetical protein
MARFVSKVVAVSLIGGIASTAPADVPTVTADRTLSASDAASYDVFGYGMAIEGETLLIGSRGCDTPQPNSGAIYAFRRINSTWTQAQKLVFPVATRDDQIGTAVALSGSVAVAGAPGRGAGGAAFILRFDGGTWFSQTEVSDSSAGTASEFGAAAACSSTRVAVGAPNASEGVGAGAGRVRVFDRPGQVWVSGQVLRAPYPDPGDRFGSAISMSGGLLAVAAPGDDDRAINSGAVYLYRLEGGQFILASKVFPPVSVAEDWFGRSVALVGSRLVIGAYQSDLAGVDAGAAFVYDVAATGVATYARTLLPPAGAINAEFGNSVATDGTAIMVGAPGFASGGVLRGASWIYFDGDAVADARLEPTGAATMDLCGLRVAISAQAAVAAAPGMQVSLAPSAGSALLVDRTRDCNGSGVPDAIEIATGLLLDGNGDGVPDQCQCIADLSGDGSVGGADLGLLLSLWGLASPSFPQFDLNRDGFVNGADLGLLLSAWGPCS